MPDIFTHFFVAHEVFKKSNYDLDADAFFLGSQGADLFYYDEVFGTKVGTRLGFVIHRRFANLLPKTFEEYSQNLNPMEAKLVLSYAAGFITHFWADSLIHPWILYRTGVYEVNDPSTVKYRYLHKRMESAIDYEIAKWLGLVPPIANFVPHHCFLRYRTLPKPIADAWAYFASLRYGVRKGVSFLARIAYLGFKFFSFVFFPPTDSRFKVAEFLEKLTPFVPWTSYLTNIRPKVDVMNRSRAVWFHPCYPEEERHETVFELFEKAVELSKSSVADYLRSPLKFELPPLSLETGVRGRCRMTKFEIFDRI